MVERVNPGIGLQPRATAAAKVDPGKDGFGAVLRQELSKQSAEAQGVAFSKHAIHRAEERGIEVTPTLLSQLNDSVEKAQAKGITNVLAFDANRAFIINVPHGRVITTLSQEEMKENIFTNIDGAVLL